MRNHRMRLGTWTLIGALSAPVAALAQPPIPPPPQPDAAVAEPQADNGFRQGKPLPTEDSMTMNLNTVEQFSVAPYKLAQAPRSNREEVADIRLVQPPAGQLPDAFIISTHDLIGTTELILPLVKEGDPAPRERRIELLVIDQVSEALKSYLSKRIKETFPTSVVNLTVANRSTAILEGFVERAEQVQPIVDLVRSFLASNVGAAPDAVTVVNALRVTGATSVQLKVIIAEVERTKTRELGFDWNAIFSTNPLDTGGVSTSTGSFINRRVNGGIGLSSADASNSNINFFVTQNGINVFEGFLRALVENNLGKLLAEPVLTTTSGQPAYFNVGGETPILIPQGNGTISIEYRDFGTNLRFVPTILGDGRIRLEVRPEVSELNPGLSVTAQGLSIPGFTTRLAETTVELESGQSFAVAGLLQKRVRATTRKIPVMGDIPAVGWLFQNKSYRQTDTELLIIVTPHLVDALDQRPCELPGRESRIPNDIEYYLGSKFEPPCFGDPYRGHIKDWLNDVPGPTPQAVPPFDNYGNPIDGASIHGIPPVSPSELGPPVDAAPAKAAVPTSPIEEASEPADEENASRAAAPLPGLTTGPAPMATAIEAFPLPRPRPLPTEEEIQISLVPPAPSSTSEPTP